MLVGCTSCGKSEFLVRLLETEYENHFEFTVILCPTIAENKTYLSRKWIIDDKNVFIVCEVEGKLNEWIKLFKNMLKGHQTLFIINDCSAEGEINKNEMLYQNLLLAVDIETILYGSLHRNIIQYPKM